MTTGAEREVRAGWYPDYGSGEPRERYWDGTQWTDQWRSTGHGPTWLSAVVGAAILLAVVGVVVVLTGGGGDEPGRSAAPPSTSSSPATGPSSEPDDATPSAQLTTVPGRRTWLVASVVDGRTLEVDNGAVVRLVGIDLPAAAACATRTLFELSDLVEGDVVTLTRRGADKDTEGRLLRYVERDGVDVGLRLIQRGLATASLESHARGAIYRRVGARAVPAC